VVLPFLFSVLPFLTSALGHSPSRAQAESARLKLKCLMELRRDGRDSRQIVTDAGLPTVKDVEIRRKMFRNSCDVHLPPLRAQHQRSVLGRNSSDGETANPRELLSTPALIGAQESTELSRPRHSRCTSALAIITITITTADGAQGTAADRVGRCRAASVSPIGLVRGTSMEGGRATTDINVWGGRLRRPSLFGLVPQR
jgi:hypothetical protein